MNFDKEIKTDMQNALDFLMQELKSLRTGRANPAILDNVMIEVYGTKMRLKDISNITVPESRQLLVTPFDPSNVNAIRKGIEDANLNILPIVDKNIIRINIPQMDESIRKQMVKECNKKKEVAKISIREIRRKYNDQAKRMEADGEMTKDLKAKFEKKIQELTDSFCKEVDTICQNKEKEILEI